ncbi:ferritin-like domain-containing protein [Aquisalinus luteolus]|uniref:Rhamnosyltransferase n=1 Tax=Aquisalinus luteolus TaxID=1566827 RepID=A0A8J3EPD0_9PROT|nr:ferritin-like domain-containing protein [Aquisalinus luteolus]GGH96540.1 rhamnosyltransferase [Aquisalinus luteolus]
MTSIFDAATSVLRASDASEKARAGREVHDSWAAGDIDMNPGTSSLPERPGRPESPVLVPPAHVPKRKVGTPEGRIALLHALTHIELNAIDLAFDMIARFGPGVPDDIRHEFITDWLTVGDDECRHFLMLSDHLQALGSSYGALPAHDGLWEAALKTTDDVMARLAIAPLVLEARGLDVTPQMIDSLRHAGDATSAQILSVIYEDEISHVAIGARWLKELCSRAGFDPRERFQDYVRERFPGGLKSPFNHEAREMAGLERNFYLNLTE